MCSRGKGDYYRLGQGSDKHVRRPKLVESLRNKVVVDVSVGSLHCIACTEDGDVYTWGDNDEGQVGGFIRGAIIYFGVIHFVFYLS